MSHTARCLYAVVFGGDESYSSLFICGTVFGADDPICETRKRDVRFEVFHGGECVVILCVKLFVPENGGS
jgi:hypothetical protein